MKLARTVRLDESDDNVFERPADAGSGPSVVDLNSQTGMKTT